MRASVTRLLGALLCGLLVFRFGVFADAALRAVRYRYSLDYGEGIVWQQAMLMLSPAAYGQIDSFPWIVFHYTPVYHFLVRFFAAVSGGDVLSVGRAVSIVSFLGTSGAVGALAAQCVRGTSRTHRIWLGIVSGLLVFSVSPAIRWSLLMRVDMVAHLFAFWGLWLAIKSTNSPRLVVPASLCFLVAVFTKQNAIAAPIAFFTVAAVIRPRVAAAGAATCAVGGTLVLVVGATLTDGRFLRHIFAYNVNRFSASQYTLLVSVLLGSLTLVAAAATTVALRRNARPPSRVRAKPRELLRRDAACGEPDATPFVVVHVAVATIMLAGMLKIGASSNYAIEWLLLLCIVAGIGLSPMIQCFEATPATPATPQPISSFFARTACVPLLLIAHSAATPNPANGRFASVEEAAELERLTARISCAERPVVSDDMVLLLRAGKRVEIEPAIAAELASVGSWDEVPYIRRIRNEEFSMFITEGGPGDVDYDVRYTSNVSAAIQEHYPIVEHRAGYQIRSPRVARADQSNPRRMLCNGTPVPLPQAPAR